MSLFHFFGERAAVAILKTKRNYFYEQSSGNECVNTKSRTSKLIDSGIEPELAKVLSPRLHEVISLYNSVAAAVNIPNHK